MELAGTIGTFFDTDARILRVPVRLAFDATDRDACVLTHVDKVIFHADATCD
jgi:hypothetical protein